MFKNAVALAGSTALSREDFPQCKSSATRQKKSTPDVRMGTPRQILLRSPVAAENVTTSTRAQRTPGRHTDAVADETNRAVAQKQIHTASVSAIRGHGAV